MKLVVLQCRIKRLGCPWKDYMQYGTDEQIANVDSARQALQTVRPGGTIAEDSYIKKREWRVVIKETTEHVVE